MVGSQASLPAWDYTPADAAGLFLAASACKCLHHRPFGYSCFPCLQGELAGPQGQAAHVVALDFMVRGGEGWLLQ
jgi:hypothetical protein